MENWLYRSECSCKTSPLTTGCKPQNRYLCYLLDEFEKCSQQSSDLSKLQKEHQTMKKDIIESQRDIRDLKFEKQLISEKVTALQREMQEQKLLHSQLRDEASSEIRSLYRKAGNHDKDVDLLKYQLKMSAKKHALDLENMRWELNTNTKKYDSTFTSTEIGGDDGSKDKL